MAEDNHINQMVILGALRHMGYHADAVGNGLEAIEAHRQKVYDVILMDAQMPEMDGKTATMRIRQMSGEKSSIPIIALTANAMETHRNEYLAVGMNDFVAKPVRMAELAAALQRCAPEARYAEGSEIDLHSTSDRLGDPADTEDFAADDVEFGALMAKIGRLAQ